MWTEQKILELARLIGERLTSSEIGATLGFSRNAVCGKANRLGLRIISDSPYARHNLAKGAYPTTRRPVTLAKSAPRGFVPDITREPSPAGEVVFMDAAPNHCRWFRPEQSGALGLICARDKFPGLSYCKTHALRSVKDNERPLLAARMHTIECSRVAA